MQSEKKVPFRDCITKEDPYFISEVIANDVGDLITSCLFSINLLVCCHHHISLQKITVGHTLHKRVPLNYLIRLLHPSSFYHPL